MATRKRIPNPMPSPTKPRKSPAKPVKKPARPSPKRAKSAFGHACHVRGDDAQSIRTKIAHLTKSPQSFADLCRSFPGLTDNQLRYQLSEMRLLGAVSKLGNGETTRYIAGVAGKRKAAA